MNTETAQTRDTTGCGSLAGKIVFVTGGGRGLGAATCHALAEGRARVVIADRDLDLANDVARQLAAKDAEALPLHLDVGNEAAVAAALVEVTRRFGWLDAVVNNAAIDVTAPIDELATNDWERIVRTNLTGPFLVARYAVPIMKNQGGGAIVNIASTASRRAWPNAVAYHATKWGLLGMSQALHAELRPSGIRVTAVMAGGMRTPFLLDRFPDIDLNNLQDPSAVARAVCFALTQPEGSVIPEIMVLPMRETSWP